MATRHWSNDAATGNFGTAGNWTEAAAPVPGDDVVFDGRTSDSVILGLDSDLDLGSLRVEQGYTGNIGLRTAGVAFTPLQIGCTGEVYIAGTGRVGLCCSAGAAADETIASLVINTTGSVYLSSFLNGLAGNACAFTAATVLKGTVVAQGNANAGGGADQHPGEDGTIIDALTINGGTVVIEDQCQDFKNATEMDLIQNGGSLVTHSTMDVANIWGGTATMGSDDFDQDLAGEDNIATLNVWAGTFNWNPRDTTHTEASPSPAITALNVYGGSFRGVSMLDTQTVAPTIATVWQFAGTVDIRNIYANFILTSYNKEGGNCYWTPGQVITFA